MKHVRWAAGLFLLAGMVALLAACKPSRPEYGASASTIETKVGQEFTIALEANITTGYNWALDASTPDPKVLAATGAAYRPPKDGALGVPGTAVLTFKGVAAGTTRVTLVYMRVWQSDAKPEKTQTFTVTVR